MLYKFSVSHSNGTGRFLGMEGNSRNNKSPNPLESPDNLNYKHRSLNVKYPFEKSSNVLSNKS